MEIKIIIEEEHPTAKVSEKDAAYGCDHFLDEPHCEALTIKLTETMKRQLEDFTRVEGFTSRGPAIRELLIVGLKYWPLEVYQQTESKRQAVAHDPMVTRFFGGKKVNLE